MGRVKKRYAAFLIALLMPCTAPGQSRPQPVPDPFQPWAEAAAELAEEYLDPEFLDALETGDREVVERFLNELAADLQSDYVLSLADLEQSGRVAVQILEQYEETKDYAAWLKPRLDYFAVSKKLQKLSPTPPKAPPGQKAPALQPSTLTKQREVWIEQLRKEPPPKEARKHVDAFKKLFQDQKVPPELVWVAEVESSFNPRARSPAGAVGMFQLMPATAERFGLSRWPIDERYRPQPSATAAAKYLRFLHGKFKDWRLALAAYNAGEGRVERLLRSGGAKTYDEIAPKLPAETQLYVPKIEAVLLRREGLKLTQLPSAR